MEQEIIKINLRDIGFDDSILQNAETHSNHDLFPARVTAEHKEQYMVRNETLELPAKISGKMNHYALTREDYPCVGDWVLISIQDEAQATIHQILPRKTILKRKSVSDSDTQIIASNIDFTFIIQSIDRDYNLNRFERYITLTESTNIEPIIILNKVDLITKEELDKKLAEIKNRFSWIDVFTTSTLMNTGIEELKQCLEKGKTYCFLGSSGVGKSSLINSLLKKQVNKTAEISSKTNRGKHVTTHRELFILDNKSVLIDNPGMRELGIIDSDKGIMSVFPEFVRLSKNCKYANCTHLNEPGCAVLKSVESGSIDKSKYNHYLKLVKENEYNTMTKLEKRKKDKSFGKFIKNSKKIMKQLKS